MPKAVLIIRVSDPRQERDGLSLENQAEVLKRYAADKGYTVVEEFKFQETADRKIRSRFQEVIKYIKSKKDVVALIGYRVDRLTRNFRDHVAMDDLRLEHGKELHFVYDHLVISASTVGMQIQQWDTQVYLAKMYLNRLKTDAAITAAFKLEHGELPGKAPFGYANLKREGDRATVRVDPKASPIVKRIFTLYATGGFSMESVRGAIKQEFHLDISKGKLDQILNNPFYMGQMRYKGKFYPHKYEPLVSEHIYSKVQARKAAFHKKSSKFAGIPYAFRGLITCGECGCRITPERKIKASGSYVYYHCTQYNGKHNAPWLTEEWLMEQFQELLSGFKLPDDVYGQVLAGMKKAHQAKTSLGKELRSNLEADHKRYESRIEKMYEDKLDGEISQEHFEKQKAKYRGLQAEINAKLQQLDTTDDEYYGTAECLLNLCQNASKLFDKANPDQKRLLLSMVLQNCVLKEKTLVWELKKPFDTVFSHVSRQFWLPLIDMFLNREIEIFASLSEQECLGELLQKADIHSAVGAA